MGDSGTNREHAVEGIRAGSWSRLDDFETCEYRAKLKYVDRIPEPDRGPPPKGLKEWHNDRGTRIHEEADRFVRGELPEPTPDLQVFEDELRHARALFEAGLVLPEQTWAFDDDWQPCGNREWDRVRLRIKADLTVFDSDERACATVIDLKTGKRRWNERKHQQQTQLYACGAFLQFPELEKVTTELWYLDLPEEETYPESYTRRVATALFKRSWAPRLRRMFEAKVFRPAPSKSNCRFCNYRRELAEKNGTAPPCEFAEV